MGDSPLTTKSAMLRIFSRKTLGLAGHHFGYSLASPLGIARNDSHTRNALARHCVLIVETECLVSAVHVRCRGS